MKIILRDFGPISYFEFDLDKDLNVIFGKNNIGKSYAITAVYLILKNILSLTDNKYNLISQIIGFQQKKIIDDFKTKESNTLNISSNIISSFKGILESTYLQNLGSSLNNTFISLDQLSNKISDNNFTIELIFNDFTILIACNDKLNLLYIKEISSHVTFEVHQTNKDQQSILHNSIYICYHNTNNFQSNFVFDCLNYLYNRFIWDVKSKIEQVYFLPYSRSAHYNVLKSLSSIILTLQKNNTNNINMILPNVSEPIFDYFLCLSSIDDNKAGLNDIFTNLIKEIESEILKGQIVVNENNKNIVFYQNNIKTEIDLNFASSMIAEIAPIVAYIKFKINGKLSFPTNQFEFFISDNIKFYEDKINNPKKRCSLLLIEEPEAHLHPEIQVKLMEIFARLVGENLKIIMTTHSNYMFNELSNLVLDGKIKPEKVGSFLMKATPVGSITDTLSMKAEADGMNDENFAEVAEKLYEDRIRIYDKLNNPSKNVD